VLEEIVQISIQREIRVFRVKTDVGYDSFFEEDTRTTSTAQIVDRLELVVVP